MTEVDDAIQRVTRLQNTCTELLETLTVTLTFIQEYAQKYNIPLPNQEKLSYFLHRSIILLENCGLPSEQNLPNRRIFTREKSDEDFTEPVHNNLYILELVL